MNITVLSVQFWSLVWLKVQLNLKSEASKSYLNYIWWVLEPAIFIAVYYVVFGILLNQGSSDFVAFLICGNIPFLWYSRTVGNCSNALSDGAGLMNQINIPKVFFPAVVILQDFIKTMVVFLLMLVVMITMGFQPTLAWLGLLPIIFAQLIFVSGIAIIFCSLIPFLPDLRFIVSTSSILLMFGSGVFYDPKTILIPEHREIFFLNPLANLIQYYRDVIMHSQLPDLAGFLTSFFISLFLLCIAIGLLKKFDQRYPRIVIQ